MTKPEIELSDLYINLSVEAGTSYDGSFLIYSRNGQEISGKVLSTNDIVVVEKKELSGTECEIPFYFKGKMSIPGEEHCGDFLLITNGGEYNIPYCVSVIPRKMRVFDVELSSLADFGRFAKENWAKAKDIFFTKEFHNVFFDNSEEHHALYHGLLKGQSKDVILDNFLQEAVGKPKVLLSFSGQDEILLEDRKGQVTLHLQGWGYIEGKISSRKGNLAMECSSFQVSDFEDGKLTIPVSLKEGKQEDILVVETVYQTLEIPVKAQWAKTCRPLLFSKKKKEAFPVLLRKYVELRTGKIEIEEYVSESLAVLPETGNFYELYEFQISMIASRSRGEKENFGLKNTYEQLEAKRTLYLNDPTCRSYYYYLMALYQKDRAALMEASIQIKDQYEKSGNFYDYLLLTMVDKNYALDFKGQCETLSAYLKQGVKSPLVYLHLLDALNKEPYYLEQLVGIRSDLMLWAVKHEYLSLELSRQFASIAMKEKYFSRSHLQVLLKLYKVKKEDAYLKAICSLFIKGNKTDVSCHPYFEDALAKNLKIVGLNEYYLRTIDFRTYPELPKTLLYYFHYSNSLDKREKAYLYVNILHNKEKYQDILQTYLIRMEEFVREQMMEGRMNRYLCLLYAHFLPDILKKKDMVKYLPNIIFKKKLYCSHSAMEGVYVKQGELEEVYVPLVDGTCQIEVFSEDATLYFADAKANRYHFGIDYRIMSYLEEENYRDLCVKYNSTNNKVRLKWMTKSVRDINDYLEQTDYQTVQPAYRRTLMNHYMAKDRMEDAYFGAELYGSDLMDGSQLYLLTCVGLYLHKEEQDDLLLTMAHRSFVKGRYNKEILLYLRQHFEGRNFDLMALWEVLKKEEMDTVEYEERMLNQLLFTGEREESMLDVLLSYLEKRENDDLTVSMLEIYSIYYFLGRKKVPESYFEILERQAKRENGLSFMSQLSYLLKKAEHGYDVEEKARIRSMVEAFGKKQVVFDFYDKFDDFVSISPLLKEVTGFYGYGEEGQRWCLTLGIDCLDGMTREEILPMEEVCPGFYYGKAVLLPGETIREKHLYSHGEEIFPMIQTTRMNSKVEGSRYEILSGMCRNKEQAKDTLVQYDRIMTRMEEQLQMLR